MLGCRQALIISIKDEHREGRAVDIEALANQYSSKTPEDILRLALESFDNVAISFSGAEDVVLVDMASRIQSDVRVFSLDTGRLHPETYRFLDRVRERYAIPLRGLVPGRHGRRAPGPREGPVQLLPGRAPGVLRDP